MIAEYSTSAPSGNGIRYYHPDRLSTTMISDRMGNVIGTEDVLACGEDAGTSIGVTEKHRFTTHERYAEPSRDHLQEALARRRGAVSRRPPGE